MADESIWKKEVSFSRKSEPPAEPDAEATSAEQVPAASETEPGAGSKETLWKREVSLTPAAEQTDEPDDKPEPLWTKEISFNRKTADEPADEQPTAEEPIDESAPGPVVAEPADEPAAVPLAEEPAKEPQPDVVEQPADVAPIVDEAPTAEVEATHVEPVEVPESVELSLSKPEPWTAPPVLPPAAELAEPAAEHPPVEQSAEPVVVHPPVPASALPPATDDEPKVPFWKKDISFGGKKRERTKPAMADEVVPADAKVPFWKKDLSLAGKGREEPNPATAEDVVSDQPKVPFWKKDLSLGSKKGPKAPKAEKPEPVSAEPKVPFWKKDLSFGGKKRDTQTADAPTVVPEVPAASTELKVPFWKKDLSFGGKKRDQAQKAKAERQPKEAKATKPKRPALNFEFGSKDAKRLVGLKIGASQLAAAKVSNNGTAELQQVARGPLEAGIVVGGELRDPDALSVALKEFFAAHGLPKRGVRLGIANNRIGVRTFEIAGIEDPKQLANAVRFRAQEALPIPIDEAVLDYQILSEGVNEEGEPTRRILLVVAYRELIDRYVDACKKAGIALTGIDLEAFALLRALQAPQDGVEGDPSAALVAVAIGHERATFAVSDGRVCEFTRVLDWGGSALNVAIARVVDAAPSEVEGVKRALALTDEMVPEGLTSDQARQARDAMRRAIQAFARELVSSLQYYQNQPGSLGIGEIVLTGGTAHLPGLAGELERMIGVRVRVGDPLARMKISKRVGEPEQVGSLAVAIGLAIED
jgi:type IV pilus assembly protein PilM